MGYEAAGDRVLVHVVQWMGTECGAPHRLGPPASAVRSWRQLPVRLSTAETISIVRMKTTVTVVFKGEPLSTLLRDREHFSRRNLTFDGPVTLPHIGEYVSNPTAGREDEPLSGVLLSRQFSYRENELNIILTLEGNR